MIFKIEPGSVEPFQDVRLEDRPIRAYAAVEHCRWHAPGDVPRPERAIGRELNKLHVCIKSRPEYGADQTRPGSLLSARHELHRQPIVIADGAGGWRHADLAGRCPRPIA